MRGVVSPSNKFYIFPPVRVNSKNTFQYETTCRRNPPWCMISWFFLFLKQHSAVPTNFFMSKKLWSHESTALKSFLAKVSHWCTASFAHTISSISHNFHLISGFAWSSTQEKKMKMKSSRHFLSEWSCLKNDIDACLIYEKKIRKKILIERSN